MLDYTKQIKILQDQLNQLTLQTCNLQKQIDQIRRIYAFDAKGCVLLSNSSNVKQKTKMVINNE